MKKLISFALACALTAACTVTAFAAQVNQDSDPQSADAIASVDINPAYLVTIPSDTAVAFNTVNTDFGKVEMTSARLEPNKCVTVTLHSDNQLENKDDATKTLPYTILEGTADNVTDTAFTAVQFTAAGEKTDLTINITQDDWNKAYAGAYSDTVTFEIAYTPIS